MVKTIEFMNLGTTEISIEQSDIGLNEAGEISWVQIDNSIIIEAAKQIIERTTIHRNEKAE